jgi:hypothetical protein
VIGSTPGGRMDDHQVIRSVLRRLSHRLRLVRGVIAGVRFLAVGLALALVPLLLKGSLRDVAPWLAGGLIGGCAVLGFLYGICLPARPAHVARLADARLGLKERLACALEHLGAAVSANCAPATPS